MYDDLMSTPIKDDAVERKKLLLNLLDRNCGYTDEEPAATVADRILSSGIFSDVVERRTGTWIEELDCNGDPYYVCSACSETWVMIDGTPQDNNMHFCPNCGADMREANNAI